LDLGVAGGGKVEPEGTGEGLFVYGEGVAGDNGDFAGRGLAAESEHIDCRRQGGPEKKTAFGTGAGDGLREVSVDAGEHEVAFGLVEGSEAVKMGTDVFFQQKPLTDDLG